MSEPTLYQTGTDEELYDLVFAEYGATSTAIVRAVKKWLTEAKRCVHGRIDSHVIDSLGGPQEWCDGAGIGDNDATE